MINRRSILGLLASFPFCGFLKAAEPVKGKPTVIEFREIEVSNIHINPYVRRFYTKEYIAQLPVMAKSIEKNGVLEPIVVRIKDDKPYVVDGLLRLLACLSIKAKTGKDMVLMCRVLDENVEVIITPSLTRQKMDPKDYAAAVRRVLERNPNMTLIDIAAKTGRTELYYKRLLRKYP